MAGFQELETAANSGKKILFDAGGKSPKNDTVFASD
jgi:hypothetical protein